MKSSDPALLKTAIDAARMAGKVLMASYGKLRNSQISVKSKNDFVTEIDKKSERLIIDRIQKSFPGDRIQAEESGFTPGRPSHATGQSRRMTGRDRLWIIDPLDGTSNYIHQFPMFSISIAVQENGVLRAGVVYDPLHDELFFAQKGKGAYLNKKRIRVTRVGRLADALMATGIPFRARERFEEYLESFKKISVSSVGLRRGGSAALDLAYVACGRFDGFWEIDLSPWDIAAGDLLVREAGGFVSDVWGGPKHLKTGDTLASNGRIHKELSTITSRIFSSSQKDKTCPSN